MAKQLICGLSAINLISDADVAFPGRLLVACVWEEFNNVTSVEVCFVLWTWVDWAFGWVGWLGHVMFPCDVRSWPRMYHSKMNSSFTVPVCV